MKIISVVGARPNFMKIAPFIHAINDHNEKGESPYISHILIHTGQHYDETMSKAFFDELDIPEPDINLGVGSGSHAEQVGHTMIRIEKVLKQEKPDWLVVVGDVNATLACSVTAKKEWIKCCHIEAGLRSHDMTMPEEINRMVTDSISDLLLTPDRLATENLKREGVADNKIVFVGNIMIDTLDCNIPKANLLDINRDILLPYAIIPGKIKPGSGEDFVVITLHRPSNVDQKETLEPLVEFLLNEVCRQMPLIWPVHPRTVKQLKSFGLWDRVIDCHDLILLHPIGYLEMLRLNISARIMLTDSGGLQEECTVLGTPCITLRRNTERPITLREYGGASVLVGNNIFEIRKSFNESLKLQRNPVRPELWDGQTSGRVLQAILNYPGD